jgi:hypothetical protein
LPTSVLLRKDRVGGLRAESGPPRPDRTTNPHQTLCSVGDAAHVTCQTPSETRSFPFFTGGGNSFACFGGDTFTGASFRGGGATLGGGCLLEMSRSELDIYALSICCNS